MSSKMLLKYNLTVLLSLILSRNLVQSRGLLLLYRPKDITDDCVTSHKLRFDLSFGMGMSDTITLVLRTVENTDYECEVDVNSDFNQIVYVVIRYPNTVGVNCAHNDRAFHVITKNQCWPVCDLVDQFDLSSRNWLFIRKGRFRFQFRSNSSINTDMEAHFYEVTVTTARLLENGQRCITFNETECYNQRKNKTYCMTSGIVCDGISNCGVEDWFDERRSECETIRGSVNLSYISIAAITGLMFCIIIAFVHGLHRCLPKSTSFFIFNADGENAFRLDPILTPGVATEFDYADSNRRKSIIPTDWSDSSDGESYDPDEPRMHALPRGSEGYPSHKYDPDDVDPKKKPPSTIRVMSQRFSRRLRSVVDHLVPHERPSALSLHDFTSHPPKF